MLGRPTTFNEALGLQICERLASGESLRSICKQDEFPSKSTVLKWILDGNHKEFADQYAKARELQAEIWADEIVEISDTPQKGIINKLGPDGSIIETREEDMLGHRRLQVDTRKWYLSKILPKKFGEKQSVAITDAEGNSVAFNIIGLNHAGS